MFTLNRIWRRRTIISDKQKTATMKSKNCHVRRWRQGRRWMWSMLAHTWKTIDCVKERIDSCLSGSEFVNPFFAFSSLLFFLVWTVCVTLSRRSCTILLTSDFLNKYFQFSSSYPKNDFYDKSLFRPLYPLTSPLLICKIVRRVFRDSTLLVKKKRSFIWKKSYSC